ncbi:phosphate ABC transporter permease subunit PstC [Bartonella sp. HY329]|uniref:phosphate ABC transporter permease subunit PstC n=1 Tax=unclassified Bartonella TaxID=2645622 RepID=UPI0021CAB27C|nr:MULTISPECIES: phosphate ABC transporter permease subunit PstC [unclassified Bartonella]UXM95515.1 phosphate ABC transporter permease subunit PstC [Bartonella sp. HY329]UXN09840.1 phosphate ABC transporter permease subunit PstC [Bartonella sp. HY328]
MTISWVVIVIFGVGLLGFILSRSRALAIERKNEKLHSRPNYYAWWTLFLAVIPSLIFLAIWDVSVKGVLEYNVSSKISKTIAEGSKQNHGLDMSVVRKLYGQLLSVGGDLNSYKSMSYDEVRSELSKKDLTAPPEGKNYMIPLAVDWAQKKINLEMLGGVFSVIIAFAGFLVGLSGVKAQQRARNKVENMVQWGLIAASTIAIFTTIGIVFSMLFQTISFFKSVTLSNFFLGTVWDPRFSAAGSDAVGQFGFVPLLAGTMYIALVAMVFAVPIGLFAAIYMSEYASSKVRSIVKPLLEILAGIPTIVYGLLAALTIGPFLRDISAAIAGGQGFIMSQSVLTAGLVMGIMLIPFVSSLSDDIINAVPQAMRDGSYGLGATQSETIKRVLLPAALPGIVGALLLTASRAIGETMIVVLAAGLATNITFNPFETMTTITVMIVNQLTGDGDFDNPQTLVAFALGITLFFITLVINIFALYIVRKYREQYE